MSAKNRQYLFGLIFFGVAIYQLILRDYLEVGLYGLAGLAFMVNALTLEPRMASNKKPLVIISWILIAGTGILFLYLLQFKYL